MKFPSWFGVIRGRKVVDRGRGTEGRERSLSPVPTADEKHGLTVCPECHCKVALLVSGTCIDCGPEAC